MYDVIYNYFYAISTLDPQQNRVVYKKDMNMAELGDRFGLVRQTISKKINGLKDRGLLIEDRENKRFLLKVEQNELDIYQNLKVISDCLSDRCANLYEYLVRKADSEMTLDEVKEVLELNVNTTDNDEIALNCMRALWGFELIDYEYDYENRKFNLGIKEVRTSEGRA